MSLKSSYKPSYMTCAKMDTKPLSQLSGKVKTGGMANVYQVLLNSQTDDVEAPSAPTNLTVVSKMCTSATLSWNEATDNIEVIEYDVYKDSTCRTPKYKIICTGYKYYV